MPACDGFALAVPFPFADRIVGEHEGASLRIEHAGCLLLDKQDSAERALFETT